MENVKIMDHPLIQHKISLLRDSNTSSKEFRELVSEIAMLMCFEATRDLPLKEVEIETPVGTARCNILNNVKIAFVPILRAGLGMVEGMLQMIPAAKVGHIGMYRDPDTLIPEEYYCKLPPDIARRDVYVLDPDARDWRFGPSAPSTSSKKPAPEHQAPLRHRLPPKASAPSPKPTPTSSFSAAPSTRASTRKGTSSPASATAATASSAPNK